VTAGSSQVESLHEPSPEKLSKRDNRESSPPEVISCRRDVELLAPSLMTPIISETVRVGYFAETNATALVTKGAAIEVPA